MDAPAHQHQSAPAGFARQQPGSIAPLPVEIVERIAAGEVIERPASVVRELIDNALDAAATSIRVELREGGMRLIRVADDGCGITASDLPLACKPHATSKITTFDDLTRLATLGFRGEALASIATVADLEVLSAADETGVASGVMLSPVDDHVRQWVAARERGTTVTARHLFRTVPARHALLGTPGVERARCLATIRAYASAYPATRFTVVVDGDLTLQTPGVDLHSALVALYGADLASGMISFAATPTPEVSVTGHISARAFTHSTRDYVTITVNGRVITNRTLIAAAESGYRPLLRKGRHPVLLAHITTPPDWIDVNVHPTKAEVLLRHERVIARGFREAIHSALGNAPATTIESPRPQAALFRTQPSLTFPASRAANERGPALARVRLRENAGGYAQSVAAPLVALAQLNDTLILARGANAALYLVDQHRAHERILFDQLCRQDVAVSKDDIARRDDDRMSVVDGYMKDSMAEAGVSQQMLLEPQLIELSPLQAAQLAPRLHELDALGLHLQPFGGHVFLVRSVPSLRGASQSLAAFVRELAVDAAVDADGWLYHVRASLACRAAIRRGQRLSLAEQQALLSDLENASAPAVCPHGSPLILAYTPEFLADVFEW